MQFQPRSSPSVPITSSREQPHVNLNVNYSETQTSPLPQRNRSDGDQTQQSCASHRQQDEQHSKFQSTSVLIKSVIFCGDEAQGEVFGAEEKEREKRTEEDLTCHPHTAGSPHEVWATGGRARARSRDGRNSIASVVSFKDSHDDSDSESENTSNNNNNSTINTGRNPNITCTTMSSSSSTSLPEYTFTASTATASTVVDGAAGGGLSEDRAANRGMSVFGVDQRHHSFHQYGQHISDDGEAGGGTSGRGGGDFRARADGGGGFGSSYNLLNSANVAQINTVAAHTIYGSVSKKVTKKLDVEDRCRIFRMTTGRKYRLKHELHPQHRYPFSGDPDRVADAVKNALVVIRNSRIIAVLHVRRLFKAVGCLKSWMKRWNKNRVARISKIMDIWEQEEALRRRQLDSEMAQPFYRTHNSVQDSINATTRVNVPSEIKLASAMLIVRRHDINFAKRRTEWAQRVKAVAADLQKAKRLLRDSLHQPITLDTSTYVYDDKMKTVFVTEAKTSSTATATIATVSPLRGSIDSVDNNAASSLFPQKGGEGGEAVAASQKTILSSSPQSSRSRVAEKESAAQIQQLLLPAQVHQTSTATAATPSPPSTSSVAPPPSKSLASFLSTAATVGRLPPPLIFREIIKSLRKEYMDAAMQCTIPTDVTAVSFEQVIKVRDEIVQQRILVASQATLDAYTKSREVEMDNRAKLYAAAEKKRMEDYTKKRKALLQQQAAEEAEAKALLERQAAVRQGRSRGRISAPLESLNMTLSSTYTAAAGGSPLANTITSITNISPTHTSSVVAPGAVGGYGGLGSSSTSTPKPSSPKRVPGSPVATGGGDRNSRSPPLQRGASTSMPLPLSVSSLVARQSLPQAGRSGDDHVGATAESCTPRRGGGAMIPKHEQRAFSVSTPTAFCAPPGAIRTSSPVGLSPQQHHQHHQQHQPYLFPPFSSSRSSSPSPSTTPTRHSMCATPLGIGMSSGVGVGGYSRPRTAGLQQSGSSSSFLAFASNAAAARSPLHNRNTNATIATAAIAATAVVRERLSRALSRPLPEGMMVAQQVCRGETPLCHDANSSRISAVHVLRVEKESTTERREEGRIKIVPTKTNDTKDGDPQNACAERQGKAPMTTTTVAKPKPISPMSTFCDLSALDPLRLSLRQAEEAYNGGSSKKEHGGLHHGKEEDNDNDGFREDYLRSKSDSPLPRPTATKERAKGEDNYESTPLFAGSPAKYHNNINKSSLPADINTVLITASSPSRLRIRLSLPSPLNAETTIIASSSSPSFSPSYSSSPMGRGHEEEEGNESPAAHLHHNLTTSGGGTGAIASPLSTVSFSSTQTTRRAASAQSYRGSPQKKVVERDEEGYIMYSRHHHTSLLVSSSGARVGLGIGVGAGAIVSNVSHMMAQRTGAGGHSYQRQGGLVLNDLTKKLTPKPTRIQPSLDLYEKEEVGQQGSNSSFSHHVGTSANGVNGKKISSGHGVGLFENGSPAASSLVCMTVEELECARRERILRDYGDGHGHFGSTEGGVDGAGHASVPSAFSSSHVALSPSRMYTNSNTNRPSSAAAATAYYSSLSPLSRSTLHPAAISLHHPSHNQLSYMPFTAGTATATNTGTMPTTIQTVMASAAASDNSFHHDYSSGFSSAVAQGAGGLMTMASSSSSSQSKGVRVANRGGNGDYLSSVPLTVRMAPRLGFIAERPSTATRAMLEGGLSELRGGGGGHGQAPIRGDESVAQHQQRVRADTSSRPYFRPKTLGDVTSSEVLLRAAIVGEMATSLKGGGGGSMNPESKAFLPTTTYGTIPIRDEQRKPQHTQNNTNNRSTLTANNSNINGSADRHRRYEASFLNRDKAAALGKAIGFGARVVRSQSMT